MNLSCSYPSRPPAELATSTLYTGTEPCAMCSGAIFCAEIGRYFYALGGDELIELLPAGSAEFSLGMPSREAFARGAHPTTVVGPVQVEGSRQVHAGFWG